MVRFTVWLAIAACGNGSAPVPVDSGATTPTTEPPILTSGCPRLPCWIYQFPVDRSVAGIPDAEPWVQVDGYTWSGRFGGPTVVAESEHEVTLTIGSAVELDLDFPGVEIIEGPTWSDAGGVVGTRVVFQTTSGPGTYIWGARDPVEARRGLFGLLTIRDPEEFSVSEIQAHRNLVFVDLPEAYTEVDACGPGTPDTGCDGWVPAQAGQTTVLIAGSLTQNYFPGFRHGGPPNEFTTSTVDRLLLRPGENIRFQFANLGSTRHTLSLGGLAWTDVDGEVVETVVLEPGAATHRMFPAIDQPGTYETRCLDHDHAGRDRILITVQE